MAASKFTGKLSARCQKTVEATAELASMWTKIAGMRDEIPGIADVGQGFPDFPGYDVARAAACSAIQTSPMLNQYSPPAGLGSLTSALSQRYAPLLRQKLDPKKNVVVTTSGAEGISCILQAFLNPGDEVILFEPFFPLYQPCLVAVEAKAVGIRLSPPEFTFTEAQLRAVVSRGKVKMIILNSPHNPTGHVLTAEEMDAVRKVCLDYPDILLLADEVYESVLFEGIISSKSASSPTATPPFLRTASFADLWPRTVTLGSASKLFALTGWRVGWVIGPEELVSAVSLIHQNVTYCAPTPLQSGIATALTAPTAQSFMSGVATLLEDNARRLCGALEETSSHSIQCYLPQGGYFVVADVRQTGMQDAEFCEWLARERKVVAVPMRRFYLPDAAAASSVPPPSSFVRFSICKCKETINQVIQRLTLTSDSRSEKQP